MYSRIYKEFTSSKLLHHFYFLEFCVSICLIHKNLVNSKDIFSDIMPLSIKINEIINDVFLNNERIMEQFIKDLFLGKVQVYKTHFLGFFSL